MSGQKARGLRRFVTVFGSRSGKRPSCWRGDMQQLARFSLVPGCSMCAILGNTFLPLDHPTAAARGSSEQTTLLTSFLSASIKERSSSSLLAQHNSKRIAKDHCRHSPDRWQTLADDPQCSIARWTLSKVGSRWVESCRACSQSLGCCVVH